MSRTFAFDVCCLWLGVVAVASAEEAATSSSDLTASQRACQAAEQKLLQSLQKPIYAKWQDVPLDDVLKEIATKADINVRLDEQSLRDEGVSTDSQISLELGETEIATALHFILPSLGLDWMTHGGVLEVLSAAKAQGELITRTYDVSAIAKVLEPTLPSRRQLRQENGFFRQGHGAGMGMFSVLPDPENQLDLPVFFGQFGGGNGAPTPERVPHLEVGSSIGDSGHRAEFALMQMLMRCGPAKWDEIDQEGGSICPLRGQLVIRQDYRAHQHIQAILQAVEALLLRREKAKSIDARRVGYPRELDAAIMRKLAEAATINVKDEPLSDVLVQLGESSHLRHWIDRASLQDEGLTTDQLVSLNLKNVPLSFILKEMLEPLGLCFAIEEGTLVVTTWARWDELIHHSICVHDTSDFTGPPDDLVNAIEKCTSGKWMGIDQEGGELYILGPRVMVICQTQIVHREISVILEDLRKNMKRSPEQAIPKQELRIYSILDPLALPDLIKMLPELIPDWDAKSGSIQRLGQSLAVTQPAVVHERVAEIIGALNQNARLLSPSPAPVAPVTPVTPTK